MYKVVNLVYIELLTNYSELADKISEAGSDLSSSDVMVIYTNMLTKTVGFGELYSQLSEK